MLKLRGIPGLLKQRMTSANVCPAQNRGVAVGDGKEPLVSWIVWLFTAALFQHLNAFRILARSLREVIPGGTVHRCRWVNLSSELILLKGVGRPVCRLQD